MVALTGINKARVFGSNSMKQIAGAALTLINFTPTKLLRA
jgi:hypothetical protein